jgi:hypothetical protein
MKRVCTLRSIILVVRSKARNIFACSKSGIVGSWVRTLLEEWTYVYVFSVFVFCVGSDHSNLATD